ncbi:MAG: hypothetical protein ABIV36_06850, partial [Sphingobium limneticum]
MQMTKVNIGAVANDGTGDPGPRGWMDVMNRNFSAADSALARVGTADTVPNLFDLAETRVTALPHIYTVAAGTLVPTIDRVAGMPCWKAVSAAAGSSTVRFSFDAALFTTGKVAGSVRFLDVSAVSGSPKVTLSITQHNAAGNQVAASAEVMVADQTGLSAPID